MRATVQAEAALLQTLVAPSLAIDGALQVFHHAGELARLPRVAEAQRAGKLFEAFAPSLVHDVKRMLTELVRTERIVRGQLHRLSSASGQDTVVRLVLSPISLEPVSAWLSFEPIRLEDASASALFQQSGEAVMVFTRNGELAALNGSATQRLGGPEEAAIGRSFASFLEPSFVQEQWPRLRRGLVRGAPFYGELRLRGRGTASLFWCSVMPVRDTHGKVSHWVLLAPDLSVHSEGRSPLMRLAFYDGLTGLPNRRLFGEHLRAGLRRAERHQAGLAVLFIDLDRVHTINDTLGHEAGDDLLRQVAQRLLRELRSADVLARIGGDDFGVVLEEVGIEQDATRVCHKLIAALTRPFTLAGKDVFCGASVGVALFPASGAGDDALMVAAESALNEARQAGRNRYAFYRAGGERSPPDEHLEPL